MKRFRNEMFAWSPTKIVALVALLANLSAHFSSYSMKYRSTFGRYSSQV